MNRYAFQHRLHLTLGSLRDLEGFYKPEVLSTSQTLSTPTKRR